MYRQLLGIRCFFTGHEWSASEPYKINNLGKQNIKIYNDIAYVWTEEEQSRDFIDLTCLKCYLKTTKKYITGPVTYSDW